MKNIFGCSKVFKRKHNFVYRTSSIPSFLCRPFTSAIDICTLFFKQNMFQAVHGLHGHVRKKQVFFTPILKMLTKCKNLQRNTFRGSLTNKGKGGKNENIILSCLCIEPRVWWRVKSFADTTKLLLHLHLFKDHYQAVSV